MKSKLFFILIFSLISLSFSYALTAHKNSFHAASGNAAHQIGNDIGGGAVRMVIDEQANALRVLIDGHERFRIDAEGAHVDGGIFHVNSAGHADEVKGGRHDQ